MQVFHGREKRTTLKSLVWTSALYYDKLMGKRKKEKGIEEWHSCGAVVLQRKQTS